jgi:hypothetical protein
METIRVKYSRRLAQKTGDDFETVDVGGEHEFQIGEGDEFETEYLKAYQKISNTIDTIFYGGTAPLLGRKEEPHGFREHGFREAGTQQTTMDYQPHRSAPPRPLPQQSQQQQGSSKEYREFNRGEGTDSILEREPVFLPNCRVWNIKEDYTKDGKPYVVVRVGNLDKIPTKNGYARVKSYLPGIMAKLKALQEQDYVNLWGYYTSWQGNEGTNWDFTPERVEKIN